MSNYLENIVKRKKIEVTPQPLSSKFADAITGKQLGVIAEIKRKSPSRGHLASIPDPITLALEYCQGGAAAISVLTDGPGFAGSLQDLQKVSDALTNDFSQIPILRKDFIVHPIQLAEAALAGANCVLLIASILKNELTDYIVQANQYGLETLTEVHDENDLEYALAARAPIIGVNNRNLQSFVVDISTSERLIKLIPDACLKVSESGIHTKEVAQQMHQLGFDAVLVGEALVTADNPHKLIAEMRGEYDKS